MQRYRDWQNALSDNAMILVMGGILPYDKLMEEVRSFEKLIGEHGGLESEQLDPQERLKDWLNGGDDVEVVN